ncbi:DUF3000 domain-containing protein [Streptomyces radicis]|uniref:DUF3000 domain-containing protein n=2 Tax=Streptomyces radicis TaxID=1750517 RepID=A0A3A9W943_9ACTN|nr:DUF3000 domain-containing protein [Streptomyces radicis]RKN14433.1 DUF3000 domain-containing protein [Streptomyces radicis]
MAASRTHQAEESGDMTDPDAGVPLPFRQAVTALGGAHPRPEVALSPLPAPRRLAPFAHALGAAVVVDGDELADGRFVLLHDPGGDASWQGEFRVVTLARADLDPELATDPLLPEVAWSWLTEALDGRGLAHREANGTVTRAGSSFFGGLGDQPPRAELELRASWTPGDPTEVGAHLLAWCGLLAQCAGLPPETSGPAVTALPRRRGPRPV